MVFQNILLIILVLARINLTSEDSLLGDCEANPVWGWYSNCPIDLVQTGVSRTPAIKSCTNKKQ